MGKTTISPEPEPGFYADNVVWDNDDKFFMLLYSLKPHILSKFAEGKCLREIEIELGQRIGLIGAIMEQTKFTLTLNSGKTKAMTLKKLTELAEKKRWQMGDVQNTLDQNGLLLEASLMGMLSTWTL